VTGGAGFIGCNTASRLLKDKYKVSIFDNLSRRGAKSNLDWLKGQGDISFIQGDVRKYTDLKQAFSDFGPFDVVIHLAAQVAVTTSVTNPREDFDINALGSFNLLEAIRESGTKPITIFASTNKVYGGMEDILIEEKQGKYAYRDYPKGIKESRILDFHSPYGCSKGSADQYMRDYFRIYDIPTVVMRQSCIYGYRQFGIEDQGWVAWFTIATALNKPITIYGDGKQVRDVLFVEDLVSAYMLAIQNIQKVAGKIFNIGGGPENVMSLLELVDFLKQFTGKEIPIKFSDWRPGDQPVYISDITQAKEVLNWEPQFDVRSGVRKLYDWVIDNIFLIKQELS